MTEFFKEKVQLASKTEALRLHVVVKCFQKGIHLSMADIESLVELYEIGYSPDFFSSCVSKGYFKSNQTVQNAVGRMTKLGILTAPKRGERFINPEYLPDTKADKVMIQYLVGNI
jgi:hypothetical protein